MSILQIGYPKCGNFWLYKILQQCMKLAKLEPTGFIKQQPIYRLAKEWELNYPEQAGIDVMEITDLQCRYRISSIFQMPIDDLETYTLQARHVWTHSPVCKKTDEVLPYFEKKVYIVRDPRDMVLSASNYYCSPYMLKFFPQEETDPASFLEKNLERLAQEWTWHVFDYLRLAHSHQVHIAFYENFLLNFQSELDRLLSYLQIELEETDRLQLEESVRFSTLKKQNPKHLQNGKANQWKQALTDGQAERVEQAAGPLLELLGYCNDEVPVATPKHEPDFDQIKQQLMGPRMAIY